MTTVGFIGSGAIGSTIARLAVEAGHQVVLSNSRGPETLADTVAELGPRASAATSAEAAAAGDIVVVTVPVKAFPRLTAAPLTGKTVIDTCNYGPERDGHIPDLDSKSITSSELLLRYLPDAVVVKAFNNIFFKHLLSLGRPAGAAHRSYLPIAGDSAPAKAAVTASLAHLLVAIRPSASTATPQPPMTSHAAWLEWTNPALELATIEPVTATPMALPNWRALAASAPATPTWSSGSPETAVWLTGGLTRPAPRPKTA
jgi:predicted dinucleotide-binding enzyme